jgi:dolichol-phosphate mannosyltransferase
MSPNSRPRVVILVPTYNEAGNVPKLIPRIGAVIAKQKNWHIQVLIIDDSSPDGTADVVRDLQKKYDFLELLINKKKSGLGGAYLKGMAQAFDHMNADVVFEMDADLSHDPKKIPEFLAALDAGFDMVLGSRYIPGGSIPSNWGSHRKLLSVFGNLFISLVLMSRAVRDWTGGYRAIRKTVYHAVREEMEHSTRFTGYTFQIGFLHKAIRKGFKITEVPFHFIDRTVGESKLGTEYIVNTLQYILKVRIIEILKSRIFKFGMVGGLGFVVNLVFFNIFKLLTLWTGLSTLIGVPVENPLFSDQGFAVVLGAEVAILSNYLLNNLWTFGDRKIKGLGKHLSKFLQFNLGSIGSVVIQYIVMQMCVLLFGIFTLLDFAGVQILSDNLYLVLGVLLGMIWNFSIYSFVIWKK